jgi:cytoskeletal protein CcmA (bactofilin family)
VRGQLSAREDLWIEGQFDGEIQAAAHQLTVSTGGRVRADVKARAVVVEGELLGNVVASEMVTVRAGGRVVGDVRSPRVVLEDGCQFQGNVDMDSSPSGGAASTSMSEPAVTSTAATSAASEATDEAAAPPAPAPATVGEGSR